MGKHTKLAATNGRKRGLATAPLVVDSTTFDSMVQRWNALLERMLESVETTLAKGEATPALLREAANIARAIVNVAAELRARDKAEKERGDELSRAVVVQWFRTRALDERRRFLLELELSIKDRKLSGLA